MRSTVSPTGPHRHVGGDERLDERSAAGVLAATRALARHLLDQHPAAGPHRAAQHLDVGRVVGGADVLTHLQGADGVEVVALGHLAVVLEPDLDPVLQTALGDPGVDELLLLRGDRDAGDLGAEVLGGVQRQRAPAAADVEHRHARLEAELGADEVELGALRVLERRLRGRVVAAAVGHLRLEDEGVELVGEVVVVADRRPVARQAVQPALDPRLRRGARRWPAERAETGGRADRVDERAGREAYAGQAALGAHREGVRQCGLQVPAVLLGDVELAGDVGLGGPELTGVPQQPAQRVGRAEHDERSARRTGDRAVPRLEPDRQVAADERADRLGETVGDTGGAGAVEAADRGAVWVTGSPG